MAEAGWARVRFTSCLSFSQSSGGSCRSIQAREGACGRWSPQGPGASVPTSGSRFVFRRQDLKTVSGLDICFSTHSCPRGAASLLLTESDSCRCCGLEYVAEQRRDGDPAGASVLCSFSPVTISSVRLQKIFLNSGPGSSLMVPTFPIRLDRPPTKTATR